MSQPIHKMHTPRCLRCGHEFGPGEIAAMTSRRRRDDVCVVDCTVCGAHNEVRSEPQPGLDEQPALVALRLADRPASNHSVFRDTVDPLTVSAHRRPASSRNES